MSYCYHRPDTHSLGADYPGANTDYSLWREKKQKYMRPELALSLTPVFPQTSDVGWKIRKGISSGKANYFQTIQIQHIKTIVPTTKYSTFFLKTSQNQCTYLTWKDQLIFYQKEKQIKFQLIINFFHWNYILQLFKVLLFNNFY